MGVVGLGNDEHFHIAADAARRVDHQPERSFRYNFMNLSAPSVSDCEANCSGLVLTRSARIERDARGKNSLTLSRNHNIRLYVIA